MAFDPKLYNVDPETGDILPTARRTLGQYLSKSTAKATDLGKDVGGADDYTYLPPSPNAFPVSPQTATDTGGTLSDPSANDQSTFVRRQEDLKRFEGAKTLTSDPTLTSEQRHRSLYDVPSVQGEATQNPATDKVIQRVSSILGSNRFTDRRPLVSTNGDPGTQNIPVTNYKDGTMLLGSSGNHEDPKSTQSSAYRKMRDEGLKILLRAAGVSPSDNVLETGAGMALVTPESIAGGLVKVPADDMRFTDSLKNTAERDGATGSTSSRRLAFVGNEVLDLGIGDEEGVRDPQYNAGSYGNLNTYLNPFDGPIPTSMIFNAVILLVASIASALLIGLLLSLLVRASNRVDFAHGEMGTLGSERNSDSVGGGDEVRKFFTDLLGLVRPYSDSYVSLVAEGAKSYTGFSDDQFLKLQGGALDPASVVGSVISMLGSSGYYVVISRSIVRNLEILGSGAADIGRQFTTGGGAISGIESLATFFDTLRKSRIVRFVDTLARLGATQEYQELNRQKVVNMLPSSDYDKSNADASLRVSKSRARVNERTLAWGFREASSAGAYILPVEYQTARMLTVQNNEDIIRMRRDFRLHSTRLKKEDVETYEARLDAEYMPFYMQDLRTNEILNFHAFIEDLSDSYAAEYTQVSAYGRMDPVQVYKGTTRSIGVTFMMVATSREDFDAMWFSINKLTSLVYPEWSKGTEIAGVTTDYKDTSFIQPFSQIPTSSPVIRLRVGDLIRSNYSRFNLARVFGLGQTGDNGKMLFASGTVINDLDVTEASGDLYKGGSNVTPPAQSFYVGQSMEVNAYLENPDAFNLLGNYQKPYRVILPSNTVLTAVPSKLPTNVSGSSVFEITSPHITLDNKELKYVKLHPSAVEARLNQTDFNTLTSPEITATSSSLINFKENSVVRSFEDAGGKGLAGVITSLQYNWHDENTTWEIDQGSKAPMMCKVTIQFNPIHDIPMGLDNNGFMRAPAYPVGRHVNSLFFNTGSL